MNYLYVIMFSFLPTFLIPLGQIFGGIPYSLGYTVRIKNGRWNFISILLLSLSFAFEIYVYIIAISTSALVLNKYIISTSFQYYFIGVLIILFFVRINIIHTNEKRKQWKETKELHLTRAPLYFSILCLFISIFYAGVLIFQPEIAEFHFNWLFELIDRIIPERK